MVGWMKTALEEAQANLTIAQSHAKSQVDYLRHDETFEVGHEVVLSTCNIDVNKHLLSKLREHWIGPYRVGKAISPMAYRLNSPPPWQTYLIFHVLKLKRFHRSKEFQREEKSLSLMVVNREEDYEVEAIHKIRTREPSTCIW